MVNKTYPLYPYVSNPSAQLTVTHTVSISITFIPCWARYWKRYIGVIVQRFFFFITFISWCTKMCNIKSDAISYPDTQIVGTSIVTQTPFIQTWSQLGSLEIELGFKHRNFHFHHCEILRLMYSMELMDLKRLMGLKMVDIISIRQDGILKSGYLNHLFVKKKCQSFLFYPV